MVEAKKIADERRAQIEENQRIRRDALQRQDPPALEIDELLGDIAYWRTLVGKMGVAGFNSREAMRDGHEDALQMLDVCEALAKGTTDETILVNANHGSAPSAVAALAFDARTLRQESHGLRNATQALTNVVYQVLIKHPEDLLLRGAVERALALIPGYEPVKRGFLTDLELEPWGDVTDGGRQVYRVMKPLVYRTALMHPGEIVVPAGFLTDLESVPHTLRTLTGPECRPAGVLHDWLYQGQPHGVYKSLADAIYHEAMRHCGLDKVWADQRLAAVDFYGATPWATGPSRLRVVESPA